MITIKDLVLSDKRQQVNFKTLTFESNMREKWDNTKLFTEEEIRNFLKEEVEEFIVGVQYSEEDWKEILNQLFGE